jgi:hypothetical protein
VHSYVFPSVVSLPLGYDCAVPIEIEQAAARLCAASATLRYGFRVFRAGIELEHQQRALRFERGALADGDPRPFQWPDQAPLGHDAPAYAEVYCEAADERAVFALKLPFSTYAIYSKPGRKSFFSDNNYKYGSPPIIDQMAEFGQYVESYPVIHLDRARDLGETLVFINPYVRAINARVLTPDGRELKGIRVEPKSCAHVMLSALLRDGEDRWLGQIQLTANNRLIVFHIKHSLREPSLISDHEHLDPFRAESTHWPLTLRLRTAPARLLRRARAAMQTRDA